MTEKHAFITKRFLNIQNSTNLGCCCWIHWMMRMRIPMISLYTPTSPITKIVNYGLIAECVFVRAGATGSQKYRAILGRFGSLPC